MSVRDARIERMLEPGTYALFLDAYDESASEQTLTVTITYAMGHDAGAPPLDAAVPETDAGAGPDPVATGCACGVSSRRGARLPALLAALALGLLMRRR